MGKKKAGRGNWGKDKRPSAVGSDDEDLFKDMDEPDPDADDYYHDAIDSFHAQRDKVLLEDDGDEEDSDKVEVISLVEETEEEEVSDADGDEDFDSDEDDLEPIRDVYERNVRKDEMASDIEDEDDGLPDAKAWGKKKSTYYHTDFVDEDYEGIADSAAELAELEEKEAKALQKKLAEQLSDADFGLELFQVQKEEPGETTQKVAKDLSKLSSEEKLKLLSKESPELLELIADFKEKLGELKDTILPLLELVEQGKITSEAGVQYLNLKRQLILQYCTNITFYLALKAKRVPVANHPVIRRLVSFRKLLRELEPVDQKLSEEIQAVLDMISKGKEIIPLTKSAHQKASSKTKRLRIMENVQDGKEDAEESVPKEAEKPKKETKVKKKFTEEEKEILDLYSAAKKKPRLDEEVGSDVNKEDDDNSASESDEDDDKMEDDDDGGDDGEQGEERRGINYQIQKNKGLTIKRKKEYRNPRVRHKMKFRRAKISRKGQVREARKEVQKYGGEISGIRAGVSRSIKIK